MKTQRMIAGAVIASLMAGAAMAESVLRLDEVPVGELDPAKASDYADAILTYNLYDTLVSPRVGSYGFEPLLAESWEVEDRIYRFKLRPGVTFVSGNPLKAEDVVFSFNRMRALGQGYSYLFESVETVEAIDDATVQFTLKTEYAPFLSSLVRLPILDSATVLANLGEGEGEMKDWGQAWLAANSAGTGAYKLVSHNPLEETVMERNPDFFLGVPDKAPDTVRLRYGMEASTVRTLMGQGEHQISSQWLPPEVLRSLSADGMQLLEEKGTTGFYVKFNTAKAPFDDLECRRAFSAAFDYEAGLKIVAINGDYALGSPATGAIPVGMLGSAPAGQTVKRDMDKARDHLSKCRYAPEDMDVEISWIGEVPIEERFALLMQANFAELGVQARVTKMPWALFSEQVSNPETTPSISQVFGYSVTGDPDTLLYSMYHSSSAGTWMSPEHLNDAKVDELLDRGRTTTDEAERAAIYAELNQHLIDTAPSIFAQDQVSLFAAAPNVSVPILSDPAQSVALAAYGFNFRFMEMQP